MKSFLLTVCCLIFVGLANSEVWAAANVRRGKLYFQKVCQSCHLKAGVGVDPQSRTIEDWVGYLAQDQHRMEGNVMGSVRYYMGTDYREKIKKNNPVAKKFLRFPEQQIFQDLRAFFMKNGSDYDGPDPCQ